MDQDEVEADKQKESLEKNDSEREWNHTREPVNSCKVLPDRNHFKRNLFNEKTNGDQKKDHGVNRKKKEKSEDLGGESGCGSRESGGA